MSFGGMHRSTFAMACLMGIRKQIVGDDSDTARGFPGFDIPFFAFFRLWQIRTIPMDDFSRGFR